MTAVPTDVRGPAPLPLVAGIVTFVGALLTLFSLLPDYFEPDSANREIHAELAFYLLFAVGLLAAAVLLVVGRATQPAGAAMLLALALTFVGSRSVNAALGMSDFRGVRAGLVLDLVGFAFVLAAAALAALALALDWRPLWAPPGRGALAVAGGVAGFFLAVAYSLHPYRLEFGGPGSAQGSPFQPQLPRGMWGTVVVVVAVTVLPGLAALARRAVAVGLAAGLGTFAVAELLHRLLLSYGRFEGRESFFEPIEGTWLFIPAVLLLGVALTVTLAVPERRQFAAPAAPPPPG